MLNRLLAVLCRSLPAYLADAGLGPGGSPADIRTALGRLVADQQTYAQRVAEAISQRGGRPDPGPFPPEFAAKNDLAWSFFSAR